MGELLDLQSQSIKNKVNTAMSTPHRLFIIAGVLDITGFIKVPTYQVNLIDGYEEWTDNNKYTHRDISERKAKGSFELIFESIEDYQLFMVITKEYKKQNGSYDCTVYCNNILDTINVEMFIDFEPINIMPYLGIKEPESLKVSVEQRGNQYISGSSESNDIVIGGE